MVQAENLTGSVVKVYDGDTFTLRTDDGETFRIRLHGIDAPEMKDSQPYCKASRNWLADMIANRTVTVDIKDTDRYGRYIGVVSTENIKDVNLEMLRAGMAWHYSHYDRTAAYAKAEKEARRLKKGLWRDGNPINPRIWRNRNIHLLDQK